jgi:TonB family protein
MRDVKLLTSAIARHTKSRTFPSFILILALFAPPFAHCQEPPDLDALASKAASQIHNSAEPGVTKILVIDFADAHAKANGLGALLADQFADLLRKNTQGLIVIDRADYARAIAEDVLTPEARADEQAARCYCRQLGADFTVEGTIDASSDAVQLNVKVTRLGDRKSVFDGTASLPLTSELRANLSKPATTAPVSSQGAKNTWTNPDARPGVDITVTPHTQGRTKPNPSECTYCPPAQFSGAAVEAKVQGTVLLTIIIDSEGRPAIISVARGLPCGLNSQALNAVKQWKFKPAEDSDGKPAAVRQMAELTFHLY